MCVFVNAHTRITDGVVCVCLGSKTGSLYAPRLHYRPLNAART